MYNHIQNKYFKGVYSTRKQNIFQMNLRYSIQQQFSYGVEHKGFTAEHLQRKAHQNDTKSNRNRLLDRRGKKERTTFSLKAKMWLHFLIRAERSRTNINLNTSKRRCVVVVQGSCLHFFISGTFHFAYHPPQPTGSLGSLKNLHAFAF